MALRVLLVAVFVVLQTSHVETTERFFLGFLDYFTYDNRNFYGECCDGVEDSMGKCQDPCDLLFQVTVAGLLGLSTTTRRLSDTPMNSSSQSKTPFQQLSKDSTNPLVFTFDEWPACAEVTVTVEVYDVDMIDTDKMELVDSMILSMMSQTPSNIDYTQKLLIGSRRGQAFRLNVVYRFGCNESNADEEDCVAKPSRSFCPGVTPLSSPSSIGTTSLFTYADGGSFGSTVISSTVKYSSLVLTATADIEIRSTKALFERTAAEHFTSFVWETPLAWEATQRATAATAEPDVVTSGLSAFSSETDFTLETSTMLSTETWLSVYPSSDFPTWLLNAVSETKPSVAFSFSSMLTTTSCPSTANLHSDVVVMTSTSAKFEEPSPSPAITDVNINKTAPIILVRINADKPMKYWGLILGCVLGGLALLAVFGFLVYLRKQRAMMKRQEVYTVTPRLVSEVEENGTVGRSDIPVETAKY